MKRSLAAVALAGLVAALPGAGHAEETSNAGSCSIRGFVSYENPVFVEPSGNTFFIDGDIQCYFGSTVDGTVVWTKRYAGTITGTGHGSAGCSVGSVSGSVDAILETGPNTRDVYNALLGSGGGALGVATLSISEVQHQEWNGVEWVTTSTESMAPGSAAGTAVQSVDDPTACVNGGVGVTQLSANVAVAFRTAPAA